MIINNRINYKLKLTIISLAFILISIFSQFSSHSFDNSNIENKRVLVISSYSINHLGTVHQIDGINEQLKSTYIDYLFMNTKIVDNDESELAFEKTIKEYLSASKKFDVFIFVDDAAFNFGIKHKSDLFDNSPMIFTGINNIDNAIKTANLNANITGIVESNTIKENYDLAIKLFPKTNKFVIVSDDTVTGKADLESALIYSHYYDGIEFEQLVSSDYTKNEIKEKISSYKDGTVIIYTNFSNDKDNNYYSVKASSELVSEHAKVPVLTWGETAINGNVLGGKVISYEDMGKTAGGMAKDILHGKSTNDISVAISVPNYFSINYQQMRKFGLNKSDMPSGTVYKNQSKSFFEKNFYAILCFAILIIALTLVIILFIRYRRKQKAKMDVKDDWGKISHILLNKKYSDVFVINTKNNTCTFHYFNSKKIKNPEEIDFNLSINHLLKHIDKSDIYKFGFLKTTEKLKEYALDDNVISGKIKVKYGPKYKSRTVVITPIDEKAEKVLITSLEIGADNTDRSQSKNSNEYITSLFLSDGKRKYSELKNSLDNIKDNYSKSNLEKLEKNVNQLGNLFEITNQQPSENEKKSNEITINDGYDFIGNIKIFINSTLLTLNSDNTVETELLYSLDRLGYVGLRSDIVRLKQIVTNMLSFAFNDCKSENGNITVNVSGERIDTEKFMLIFNVRSNGYGIEQDDIDLINKVSYKKDLPGRENIFSLIVSKYICELLGGQLKVTSKPNVYTDLLCEIPVYIATLDEVNQRT